MLKVEVKVDIVAAVELAQVLAEMVKNPLEYVGVKIITPFHPPGLAHQVSS